jgi:hypothetical protein
MCTHLKEGDCLEEGSIRERYVKVWFLLYGLRWTRIAYFCEHGDGYLVAINEFSSICWLFK